MVPFSTQKVAQIDSAEHVGAPQKVLVVLFTTALPFPSAFHPLLTRFYKHMGFHVAISIRGPPWVQHPPTCGKNSGLAQWLMRKMMNPFFVNLL